MPRLRRLILKKQEADEVERKKSNSDIAPIKQGLDQLTQHVKALHEHHTSPIEFVRGQDGKVAGIKRGNQTMMIHRDQHGKASRIQ